MFALLYGEPYIGDCRAATAAEATTKPQQSHSHTVTVVQVQRVAIRIVGVQFNIESRRHRIYIFRIASTEIRRSF